MEHSKLGVSFLTPERHRQTCGYWFTVHSAGTSHCAFATRSGLNRWLDERGLELENFINEQGQSTCIIGSYRTSMHMDSAEFHQIDGVRSRTLSNGQWVVAIIAVDPDGIHHVHTLNPNVRDRETFDYRESHAMMM